jgi:hypothetical protein
VSRSEDLQLQLVREHDAFVEALEAVDLELVTVPGVVEDWSVRDLVVHVAFWLEHATNALRLAAGGHGDEFGYDTSQTDAMNARLLDESRKTPPDAALERMERAFDDLAAVLAALDPALLDLRLGNGDTVVEVVAYDGPEHYREHTAHLRAWFDGAEADTDTDEDDDDAAQRR